MGWWGTFLFSKEETQLRDYIKSLNEKQLCKFVKEVEEKEKFVEMARKILSENEEI